MSNDELGSVVTRAQPNRPALLNHTHPSSMCFFFSLLYRINQLIIYSSILLFFL